MATPRRKPSLAVDLAVVGGGSAGYAAARTAASAGLRVAILDGAPELGGLCILRGCMPTKALLHASEVLHLLRRAPEFGLRAGSVGFRFRQVLERKARLIRDFAEYRQGQLADGRFELIRSPAKFRDPHTLELSDGRCLSAAHFVIATGSVVSAPPVPGLAESGYLTSDDALELPRPPRSMIVLGGGAVALEFAQFYARFGTRVTVVQRSPQVLKNCDPDASAALEQALSREGLRVLTGTHIQQVRRPRPGKHEVRLLHHGQPRRITADSLLMALGRTPNTAGLNLDQAGVRTERGRIVTDHHMRTSAPHIYAAGDCASPHEIVHLAVLQGEIAGHNIAFPRRPRAMDYRLLIHVVFTEPQVAVVGLTEREAAERSTPFRVATYPFADHGKSLILGATDGFVKLLAHPKSGEILGGCCVGPQGGELIHEIVAAMAKRMTAAELAAMPHYHPTLAEIWTYPAEELASASPAPS